MVARNAGQLSRRLLTLVDSAVLVGMISAATYISAYQYDEGYLAYFGAGNSSFRFQLEKLVPNGGHLGEVFRELPQLWQLIQPNL